MAVLPFPMDRSMESYIENVHIFNKDFPILPKRALGPSIPTMAILTLRFSRICQGPRLLELTYALENTPYPT
jgi:hypothetical protein